MKKSNLLISLLLIFLLIVSSILMFEPNLRRNLIKSIIPVYNIYNYLALRSDVRVRNYKNVANRIENQIKLSNKFSKNKTSFANGIYDNMELAFKNALYPEEFNHLKRVSEKLLLMDPSMYMAHIWFAQSNAVANDDLEKILLSLESIHKAIKIASAREEAYRVGIKIASENNLNEELDNLCNNYFVSQSGGLLPRTHKNFFGGLGIRKMALFIDKANEFYSSYAISLNKDIYYDFHFSETKKFNKFNLILSLLPGIKIEIKDIIFKSSKNNINPKLSEVLINTKAAYIVESNDNLVSLITNDFFDKIIFFKLKDEINNIDTISLLMNFKRLPLTNLEGCINLKE